VYSYIYIYALPASATGECTLATPADRASVVDNTSSSNLPPRMLEDAKDFTPFKTLFYYELVDACYSPKNAIVKEHAAITAHHATSTNGYNTLAGHPPLVRKVLEAEKTRHHLADPTGPLRVAGYLPF
jgi:hypothetical protein